MKEKITKAIRIILGSILLIFGLNKGLNFFDVPTPPEGSFPFWTGLVTSSYILPTIMFIEIITGLCLIFNRYVKLALLLMLPVTYGFVMYHLFLDMSGILLPLIIAIFHGYLFYLNRRTYKTLLG